MEKTKDMKIIIDKNKIKELLSRSVEEILPSKEKFAEVLSSGKRLRIYIGTDATGSSLHLGHATNYMILEKLRAMGHEVIFLIGDFTSRIGDPTDKDAARVQLSRDDVIKNTETWLKQIEPIIKTNDKENPVKIKYNHDWLSKMSFEDVIDLSSNFTVQQMLERDMFEKRMTENKPIYVHEFFYPLMQGWDSVVMDVDVEMCGNDQKFNALVGRTLQKRYNNKEKFVFITTLLENPVTKEKMMSKSLGTGIFLDWSAYEMFGGVMAQVDENMRQLFVDTTFLDLNEIEYILANDKPKDAKLKLALEIVKIYHGTKEANEAKENWEKQFSKKEIPDNLEEFNFNNGIKILEVLKETKLSSSNSNGRRKIDEKAVQLDGKKLTDHNFELKKGEFILKLGKKMVKINIK